MRYIIAVLLILWPMQVLAETELWLVRHAEKQAGLDPALTKTGKSRARVFGHMFSEQGVTRVFSTHTKRTIQTALPTVERVNGQIEFYDPSKMDALAAMLCALNEKTLVVGHSNTTPRVVNAIMGEHLFDDHDEADYDTAYRVTCGGDTPPQAHKITVQFSSPKDDNDAHD